MTLHGGEELTLERKGDLGEAIGPNGLVRLGADDFRPEQPVRVEDDLLRHARRKKVVPSVFATDRRAAPNPMVGQFESATDHSRLRSQAILAS